MEVGGEAELAIDKIALGMEGLLMLVLVMESAPTPMLVSELCTVLRCRGTVNAADMNTAVGAVALSGDRNSLALDAGVRATSFANSASEKIDDVCIRM